MRCKEGRHSFLSKYHAKECLIVRVITSGKFTYCPVYKNGYTTFTQFFLSNGWTEVDLEDVADDSLLFGHIQDPDKRHTKGVAEYFLTSGIVDIDDRYAPLVVGIFDTHTVPITGLYPDHYDRIHWILMETVIGGRKFSCNELTNFFFHKNNIPLKVSDEDIKNNSDPDKIRLQETVRKLKEKHQKVFKELYSHLMMEDRRLYFQAMSPG